MRQGITVHTTVKLGYLYSFAMMLVGFVLFFVVGNRDDSIGSIIWAAAGLTVGLLGLGAAVATTIVWVLLDDQSIGRTPKALRRRVPIDHEES
jgi:hypothetical protein